MQMMMASPIKMIYKSKINKISTSNDNEGISQQDAQKWINGNQ